MTASQAFSFISVFYRFEVEKTGNDFTLTSNLKECIEKLSLHLTLSNKKWGIFITGNIGNGKTTLLKALSNGVSYLINNGYIDNKGNYNNIFKIINAKDVVRLFVEDKAEYQRIVKKENLLIDDVGEEPFEVLMYGVPYQPMLDLLKERYANHLFTIITSNLGADKIKERYKDMRLADRLKEMFTGITFKDKSFR